MTNWFNSFIYAVCTFPGYYGECIKNGLDLSQVPECKNKPILDKFIREYEVNGPDVAKNFAIEAGVHMGFEVELIPFEMANIPPVFRKKIELFKAYNLAKQIEKNPENADYFIEKYQLTKNSPTSALSLNQMAADIIKDHVDKISGLKKDTTIRAFPFLSALISGFNPGRVTMISASSGFGKTTLSVNLINSAADDTSVGLINMEMIRQDIVDRILQSQLNTTQSGLLSHNHDKVIQYLSSEKSKRVWITDGKSMSLSEIRGLITKLKENHGVKIVFVDYDQKIELQTTRETPEWKALQLALQGLESIAKSLELHIVVLSQANDEGSPSGSKRSIYPVSTSLWFHKENDKYLITPIKNRFGPTDQSIEVVYELDKSKITERGYFKRQNRSSEHTIGSTFKTNLFNKF